jgi:hypothetical protein
MSSHANRLATGAALAAAICLLVSAAPASADEKKQARADILELVKDLEAGKAIAARARGISGKYDELQPIMEAAFKPRARGGIGFGPKSTTDGIEQKIHNLGKGELRPAQLKDEQAELVRLGNINLAMVDVVLARKAPNKPGKSQREWNMHSEDMRKSAQDLIAAAKAGDPAKLKAAAANLNSACNGCHSDFR